MAKQCIWLLAAKIVENLAENRRKRDDRCREYLEFWRARAKD